MIIRFCGLTCSRPAVASIAPTRPGCGHGWRRRLPATPAGSGGPRRAARRAGRGRRPGGRRATSATRPRAGFRRTAGPEETACSPRRAAAAHSPTAAAASENAIRLSRSVGQAPIPVVSWWSVLRCSIDAPGSALAIGVTPTRSGRPGGSRPGRDRQDRCESRTGATSAPVRRSRPLALSKNGQDRPRRPDRRHAIAFDSRFYGNAESRRYRPMHGSGTQPVRPRRRSAAPRAGRSRPRGRRVRDRARAGGARAARAQPRAHRPAWRRQDGAAG